MKSIILGLRTEEASRDLLDFLHRPLGISRSDVNVLANGLKGGTPYLSDLQHCGARFNDETGELTLTPADGVEIILGIDGFADVPQHKAGVPWNTKDLGLNVEVKLAFVDVRLEGKARYEAHRLRQEVLAALKLAVPGEMFEEQEAISKAMHTFTEASVDTVLPAGRDHD